MLLGLVYGEGWAAALAHRTGLQGRVCAAEQTLHLRHWPADAPPLRVGFASDFHAGPTTHPALLRAACAALAEADVDLLLLGGDFVSLHARHVERLTGLLASVPAPLGRFAVLGNHDLWADDAFITARLEEAGIQVLTNRNVRLSAPHGDLWICGLDDPTRGEPDAVAALHGAEGRRLVLMHSPDGLLALQPHRFDLAFCGHTHAGQVALPSGRTLVVPEGDFSRRFTSGLFDLDGGGERQLLVSPG
ncbi:MAG TPA: metallophosphoesterase, partial [Gemmatimonadaceae bacterium]|nr:metallophosphoesterase [Gemmatimonadaceae bacterium]